MNLSRTLPIAVLGVLALGACSSGDLEGHARITDDRRSTTTDAAAAPADDITGDAEAAGGNADTDTNFAALMATKHVGDLTDILELGTEATDAITDGDISQAADFAGQVADGFHDLVDVTGEFDAPLAVETTGVFEQCETAWTHSAAALDDFDPDGMSAAGDELGECGDSLTGLSDYWG